MIRGSENRKQMSANLNNCECASPAQTSLWDIDITLARSPRRPADRFRSRIAVCVRAQRAKFVSHIKSAELTANGDSENQKSSVFGVSLLSRAAVSIECNKLRLRFTLARPNGAEHTFLAHCLGRRYLHLMERPILKWNFSAIAAISFGPNRKSTGKS